jgi:cytochrome c oxidase subunit 1
MMGGTLIAFLGGLHYWWPKMFGRRYSETWGRLAAVIIFVGFNVTFFTQFVMGSQGMPRRYYNYPEGYTGYHVISTIGSYLLAVGFFMVAIYLVHSLIKGKRSPANPWGGASLEWRTGTPPPLHNFVSPPVEGDPYDFTDLVYEPETDGYRSTRDAGPETPVESSA